MQPFNQEFKQVMARAATEAQQHGHRFIGLEHVLTALCENTSIRKEIKSAKIDPTSIPPVLDDYFSKHTDLKEKPRLKITPSFHSAELTQTLAVAFENSDDRKAITPLSMLIAIGASDSYAGTVLRSMGLIHHINGTYTINAVKAANDATPVDSDPSHSSDAQPSKKPGSAVMVLEAQDTPTPTQKRDIDEEEYNFSITDLPDFCINMTEKARAGKYVPAIGRDKELKDVADILARYKKKSVLLHGTSGVGKTAIVEGLVWNVVNGKAPAHLKNANFYALDTSALVSGTRYHGMFEEKFKLFLSELKKDPNGVLFVDDMETLVGLGATATNTIDASTMLRSALASGEIRFIGAAAEDDMPVIEKDASLMRRIRKVEVKQPNIKEAIAIASKSLGNYEAKHNVSYSQGAIAAAAKLSKRYIPETALPDIVFEILDDAGVHRKGLSQGKARNIVTSRDVQAVVSTRTGASIGEVGKSETARLADVDKKLKENILNQDDAMDVLADAVRRDRAPFRDPNQPAGSFLFIGPTGVGKTEAVKQLAKIQNIEIVRLDMSEFMEKHSVSKLIGAPPGYIGYEGDGQLTGPIRKKPHTLLLLDEIEKAHPDIFNVLLQVMDHGCLTDGQGRTVDFRNVMIVMTSNAGVAHAKNSPGFTAAADSKKQNIIENLKTIFAPEFLNRLSAIVPFDHLEPESMEGVTRIQLRALDARVTEQKMSMHCKQSAIDWLVENGTNRDMGARPMKHLIRDEIETVLAAAFIDGRLKKGGKVTISFNEAVAATAVKGKKGLSFEFENPSQKPRKAEKPILLLEGPKAA